VLFFYHVERSRLPRRSFMRRLGDISYDLNPIQVRDSLIALGMTKKYRGRITPFLAVIPSGVEGARLDIFKVTSPKSLDSATLRSG
jgi:hypothetical protein